MRSKEKEFENLIWKAFSQDKNHDGLRYRLIRIRNIMCKKHSSFNKMSVKRQYDYSVTIAIIATHSAHQNMNEVSVIKREKKEFEFSITHGFVQPVPVVISGKKLLKQ